MPGLINQKKININNKVEHIKEIFKKGVEPTFVGFDEQTGKLCSFAQLRLDDEDADYPYEIKLGEGEFDYYKTLNEAIDIFLTYCSESYSDFDYPPFENITDDHLHFSLTRKQIEEDYKTDGALIQSLYEK